MISEQEKKSAEKDSEGVQVYSEKRKSFDVSLGAQNDVENRRPRSETQSFEVSPPSSHDVEKGSTRSTNESVNVSAPEKRGSPQWPQQTSPANPIPITLNINLAVPEEQPRPDSSQKFKGVASPWSPDGDPAPPLPPPITFPDGGFVAWSQVAMGFLIMFSTWGIVNAWGIFQTYYNLPPSLGTKSAISWIGSTQSCLLLLSGAIWGRAVDMGYAKTLTSVGSILIVASLFLTSISGQGLPQTSTKGATLVYYQILLTQGVLGGLGMGLTFLTSVGVPATYFLKRRALATGIVTTGASFGGIIYPIVFEYLLQHYGFRWAIRILGFMAAATLFLASLLVRQRRDLPQKAKQPLIQFTALKDPKYAVLVAGMCCSFFGCYIPYYYLQGRVRDAGVDLKGMESFYFVCLLNTGGVAGRIIPNRVADKIGPLRVHTTVVLIGGILIFIWPFVLNLPGLIVYTLVYGFFSGAFISLPPATIGSITPDMSQFGSRLGLAVSINGLGLLAGPPIAGALISGKAGYTGAAILAGLVVVLGGVCLAMGLFGGKVMERRKERKGNGMVLEGR
ncbi:hypothetical protein HYFRA_00006402 [Hymenoscyphus fraxineus]|uniref:Major facilitator superfamily (MFS) profile domain-containing protein n=1 Tax=Hymenoscyphus fraxineus TaxID=746836 RepID=A0A9N9PPG0_9HELO|nr:hypothetical protein HYFRA_00006402 [Hymenoscyphus fraxineus]